MTQVTSAWPVLAEQAQKRVAELEAKVRAAKDQEQQLKDQLMRVTNMVSEYRIKQHDLERSGTLADSVNCRQFLSQLSGVAVTAETNYMRYASVVFALNQQLKAAYIEQEKMKKLVEREKKAQRQLADKQAQKSLDDLATMRHGWRHA
jgi:flagellar biosynthesis chaperone FliJ